MASSALRTPAVRLHGSYRAWGEVYVTDLQNRIQREITSSVLSGTVEVDWHDDIAWKLQLDLEDDIQLDAYRDAIAPYLTVEWRDDRNVRRSVREQLGLYLITPPSRTYHASHVVSHLDGRDTTWALGQQTARRTHRFGHGIYCGNVSAALLYDQTRLRLTIPRTDSRTGKVRIVKASDNLLSAANEPLRAAGYHPLRADHTGHIRSWRQERLADVEPRRHIDSRLGDISGTVELEPEEDSFYNWLSIRSTNPSDDRQLTDGYTLENVDPDDPYSTTSLGYAVAHEIADANVEDLDALKRQAYALMERASSVSTRLSVTVPPDPRLDPWETWDVDIITDGGRNVARTKRFLVSTRFAFDRAGATQEAVLQRVNQLREVL